MTWQARHFHLFAPDPSDSNLSKSGNCSMVPVSFDDDFIIYTVPIMLNGTETNLRMTYSYIDNSYTINGIWDGIEEENVQQAIAILNKE